MIRIEEVALTPRPLSHTGERGSKTKTVSVSSVVPKMRRDDVERPDPLDERLVPAGRRSVSGGRALAAEHRRLSHERRLAGQVRAGRRPRRGRRFAGARRKDATVRRAPRLRAGSGEEKCPALARSLPDGNRLQ